MDTTGYTQRQSERNNKILQELLSEVRSIKREVVLIKQKQTDINKKWELISKREVPEPPIAQQINGWFWFA